MSTSFIIGVAGGSGSGKSTVTDYIINEIGRDNVTVVIQDYYYKDLPTLQQEQGSCINFDHPNAFDWQLLIAHITDLYNGMPINMPTYDYTKSQRLADTITVNPSKVVIVEGIFSLLDPAIRDLMALKIFVDTASDIRFIRRLQRDIEYRGRSASSVITQYMEYVRPMHNQFIEPTKRYSHIIIPNGANRAALEMIIARINAALNNEVLLRNEYHHE